MYQSQKFALGVTLQKYHPPPCRNVARERRPSAVHPSIALVMAHLRTSYAVAYPTDLHDGIDDHHYCEPVTTTEDV